LDVWKDERGSRDNGVGLMWENMRFYSVLIPSIITVYTLFLGLINQPLLTGYASGFLKVSWAFPSAIIVVSAFGIIDLYCRWNRILEEIAHLRKA